MAKTDKIDAALLTDYGQRMMPEPSPMATPNQSFLQDLVRRRCDLVEMRTMEQNRLEATSHEFHGGISRVIDVFDEQIEQCSREIQAIIDSDPDLSPKDKILQSVAGVGSITSTTLLARLPELGTLEQG